MPALHFTPSATRQRRGYEPPIVGELQALFAGLPDSELLTVLAGPVRRGPKGYPVTVLWRCLLVKYSQGVPSTAALIRLLRNNPYIAQACGIPSPRHIPHEATLSRFLTRLSRRKVLMHVKNVSRAMTRLCYDTIPNFGQRVALDSTTLKAWSNGGKTRKADPDAGWSIKRGTNGPKEFTFGWKLHLLVDCATELPVAANVSAGNVNDYRRATHVLREARFTTGRFRPQYVMADAGYSGFPLMHEIRRQYRAIPVIQINASHRRALGKKTYGVEPDEWKRLFAQRPAVERVFSRLKGQRSLNHITVRRRMKVTTHCYLSLIALQGARLVGRGCGLIG